MKENINALLDKEENIITFLEKEKKSFIIQIVLALLLGSLGAHRFYRKENNIGFIYLGLFILSIVLSSSTNVTLYSLSHFISFALFIFVIKDLFMMFKDHKNKKLKKLEELENLYKNVEEKEESSK